MNDTQRSKARPDRPGSPFAHNMDLILNGVSKSDTTAEEAQAEHNAQDLTSANKGTAPELIPTSPEFDVKKYREMLRGLDLDGLENRLKKAVTLANDAAEAAANEITQSGIIPQALGDTVYQNLQEILEMAKWAKEAAQDILTPELRRLFDFRETLESFNWKTFIAGIKEGEKRIKALEPFLEAELPAIRSNPGFEAVTLEDVESYIGLDGQTIADSTSGDPVPACIREAIERAAAAALKAGLLTSTARRADIVEYPVDKLDHEMWKQLREPTGNQTKLFLPLKAEKDGSDKELTIQYSIDFAALDTAGIKITKRLMPFDKLVYIAIAALYNAGNKVISLTQVYYAMGNTGKPATYQIQKIQDRITKMTGARVYIDNLDETTTYNYPRFKYDGPLLPVERATAIVNGKIADAALHLFREPPVMTFAKQRKQITTITVKMLQSPISKTDANLLIDDYLIERIAKAKRNSKKVKILYSTLYEAAQITTKNKRSRAPEKIKTYLDHYKESGFISEYTMLPDGIQIFFEGI